jgi:glucose/arabinose dehydrogenase
MALAEEAGRQVLYAAHTGRGEVLALTLDGEVLWRVGWPETSGLYAGAGEYRPTSVAVAPDGGFFVADGYGKSWIHRYDAGRSWVRAFGGPGSEPGKLATPHGIWVDTRGERPLLLVADRENRRIQRFDLEGEFVDVLATDLERPCHMHPWGDDLAVPELAGGVAILDAQGSLVTRLGANPDPALRAQNGVGRERWAAGELLSPHCATFDASGNLYVLDWNAHGRVSKLVRAR